jgi:hypothetical protein
MDEYSLTRAYRGSISLPIRNDRYIEFGENNHHILIISKVGYICLSNPTGLYVNINNPNKFLLLKFNASNTEEKIYIKNTKERNLYTKTNYVMSCIKPKRLHCDVSLLYKMDKKLKSIKYDKTNFTVKYDKMIHVFKSGEFLEFLQTVLNLNGVIITTSDMNIDISYLIDNEPWDLSLTDSSTMFTIYKYVTTRLDNETRSCPILFSRKITEIIGFTSSKGTQGIIEGKWLDTDQKYTDSSSIAIDPLIWHSTKQVFDKYLEINAGDVPDVPLLGKLIPEKVVKYAQCFTFGCLAQSFYRAFGIPCRIVRTENAGHDKRRSYVIVVTEGEELPVWNFHVWNEVWMSRPDIPKYEEAGWQVVDSTPQGYSKVGEMEPIVACGPCPLKAVKNLDIDIIYDCKFMIAEVNPVIASVLLRDNKWIIYNIITGSCGTSIMRETSSLLKKSNFLKLVESREHYIDESKSTLSLFKGPIYYDLAIDFSKTTDKDVNITIKMVDSEPSLYNITGIFSYEYEDGPLNPEEITDTNVNVISFTNISNIFTLKSKFEGCSVKCYNTTTTCKQSDTDHSDCACIPTIKIYVDSKKKGLLNANFTLIVYQYIKSVWIKRVTM